jgi:ABC-2 type transport system permease protein
MRRILHMLRKEFLQFRRDRKMVGMSFIAPVFQLIILGYAANLDVSDIPLVVCDLDRSAASRDLVAQFTSSGYFRVVAQRDRLADVDGFLDNGTASMAMIIPLRFADNLTAGRTASLQLIVDGSETNSATVGLSYAQMIVARRSQEILMNVLKVQGRGGTIGGKVLPELRVWYNPELRSRNFLVPGVLALLLMVMTLILTSLAIVKEKELGTLEQIVVTPIQPYQLIIGKLSLFVIIGFVDVLLVVMVSAFLFGLPVKGSLALLIVLCLVFLMTTLGLGLFISTVSRTQQQAMMSSIFFVMLPMIFLSGFVFPIENMPGVIQGLTYLLPLRYFFVIIRGIFLKGVGPEVLWPQALAMLGFGVGILGLSILRFRKRVS